MIQAVQNTSSVTENAGENLLEILLPKSLDWPFLFFLGLLAFCWWFRVELKSVLRRGDILLSWGDRSIRLRELSKSLDEELEPIRDDIESLKRLMAETGNSAEILPTELFDADHKK